MLPRRATLCRRRFDRRPKLTRVSSAPEACAGNSNLLKTPFPGRFVSRAYLSIPLEDSRRRLSGLNTQRVFASYVRFEQRSAQAFEETFPTDITRPLLTSCLL